MSKILINKKKYTKPKHYLSRHDNNDLIIFVYHLLPLNIETKKLLNHFEPLKDRGQNI